jgi:parallel beta-helix repeat protein
MEPKSIAFYTAVAVSILAVLSATTFPMVAQAQETTDEQEPQEQPAQEDSNNEDNNEDNNQAVTQSDSNNQQQTDGEDGNSATSNGNGAAGSASERLGLQPNSGIASCGQVVTQDVALTSDLNCDSGDGLIVGASGITINLNGYSITSSEDENGGQEEEAAAANPTSANSEDENGGQEEAAANSEDENGGQEEAAANSEDENGGQEEEEEAAAEPEIRPVTTRQTTDYDGSSGILVANADNVAISGLGEISGFSRGVTFLGSSGGAVTDIQLANNDLGVVVASSEGTEISRNTITNNGIAVVSDGSNGGVTAFNQVVANLEQGILIIGSSDNVVAANNMYGNGASGIFLDPMSQRNHLDYNTVFGHETADLNNADGMPTNVNQNSFGDNNNCGTSLPGGLCR